MAAFPKEWMVRLLLMLIAVVATREITQAQTASLQGFGGTFSQPYRSGDLVVVFGTNIFSNQSPCDQVILYTGGLVGDTINCGCPLSGCHEQNVAVEIRTGTRRPLSEP